MKNTEKAKHLIVHCVSYLLRPPETEWKVTYLLAHRGVQLSHLGPQQTETLTHAHACAHCTPIIGIRLV